MPSGRANSSSCLLRRPPLTHHVKLNKYQGHKSKEDLLQPVCKDPNMRQTHLMTREWFISLRRDGVARTKNTFAPWLRVIQRAHLQSLQLFDPFWDLLTPKCLKDKSHCAPADTGPLLSESMS